MVLPVRFSAMRSPLQVLLGLLAEYMGYIALEAEGNCGAHIEVGQAAFGRNDDDNVFSF